MIRTILWFINFILYMIATFFKSIKLFFIVKFKRQEAGEEYIQKVVRAWARFSIKTIGAEIEVVGRENLPEGNCVFIGNHQGYLDIPLIYANIDKKIGFIAKKEMEKVPIMSNWMRLLHCIFMDRENPKEAIKSINQGVEYLKMGYSMVIFPEGTRSKGNYMREFKKGSMKLALKSQKPIVPITIYNSFKVFEENKRIKPAKVKLIIHKPIYVENLSKEEQNNLSQDLRNIIENSLNSLKLQVKE